MQSTVETLSVGTFSERNSRNGCLDVGTLHEANARAAASIGSGICALAYHRIGRADIWRQFGMR